MAKYFMVVGGDRTGPVSPEEMRTHGLAPDTLVWTEGMDDYVRAEQVPELAGLLGAASRETLPAEVVPRRDPPPEHVAIAMETGAQARPAHGPRAVASSRRPAWVAPAIGAACILGLVLVVAFGARFLGPSDPPELEKTLRTWDRAYSAIDVFLSQAYQGKGLSEEQRRAVKRAGDEIRIIHATSLNYPVFQDAVLGRPRCSTCGKNHRSVSDWEEEFPPR